jgi:hypothetical protein
LGRADIRFAARGDVLADTDAKSARLFLLLTRHAPEKDDHFDDHEKVCVAKKPQPPAK